MCRVSVWLPAHSTVSYFQFFFFSFIPFSGPQICTSLCLASCTPVLSHYSLFLPLFLSFSCLVLSCLSFRLSFCLYFGPSFLSLFLSSLVWSSLTPTSLPTYAHTKTLSFCFSFSVSETTKVICIIKYFETESFPTFSLSRVHFQPCSPGFRLFQDAVNFSLKYIKRKKRERIVTDFIASRVLLNAT